MNPLIMNMNILTCFLSDYRETQNPLTPTFFFLPESHWYFLLFQVNSKPFDPTISLFSN